MGYQIPADHELVLSIPDGRKIAVAAFDLPAPFGTLFEIGIYQVDADGSATMLFKANDLEEVEGQDETGPMSEIGKMQAAGGAVAFLNQIKARLNVELAKIVSPVIVKPTVNPTSAEPATDADARGYMVGALMGWNFVMSNGKATLV
jgi:hypothetical protein